MWLNGRTSNRQGLPAGIWLLGFGSMLMDISSELVHSLLPVFMASVLGASMVTIGTIEGIAEATATVTKMLSGAISDRLGRRKFFVVLGYGLSAMTKPVFPLAGTIGWVFGARLVDRIGKGVRDAPRDALVADLVPARLRGSAYGLRQALDSAGACLGPLFAMLLMIWLVNDIRSALWAGVLPAFAAVALIALVREVAPAGPCQEALKRSPLADAKRLTLRFWIIAGLGGMFALARFSDAFLVLRAQNSGLPTRYVPAIMVAMNLVYAAFAYPAGVAADRLAARILLICGLAVLIAADLVLAWARAPWTVFLGATFWGLHMALTQGLLSKLVADTAPAELRGTAFGLFNLVTAGGLLAASVIAGSLWSAYGAQASFLASAAFAALASVGLLCYRAEVQHSAPQAR